MVPEGELRKFFEEYLAGWLEGDPKKRMHVKGDGKLD